MSKQRSKTGANNPQTVSTDFDDWETDPDYIRDMDEMDQRWGAKRTIGSINMSELIDQVNRDHKLMREKFQHPWQTMGDFSKGDIPKRLLHEPIQGYEERLSKHSSSQEISRKVYTSTSGSESGIKNKDIGSPERRIYVEQRATTPSPKPKITTKPEFINYNYSRPTSTSPLKTSTFFSTEPKRFESSEKIIKTDSSDSPYRETSSTTKRIFREEKSSTSSSRDNIDSRPQAFKSIQDKIDAFKKEFDDIESKVSRKSDLSKVIKKSSNFESKQSSTGDINYISRNSNTPPIRVSPTYAKSTYASNGAASGGRPSSAASTPVIDAIPRTDIKGLSKRFETLCRESDDDFRLRTEAKRREFFDQIKNQVRETRKNLDGYEPTTESDLGKSKVYTRCESTKEEIVSKLVKEGDKILENETKRNVEHTSSCHGSSDDETESNEPHSIKYINQQLSKSPTDNQRAKSPIDEIRKKVPNVEPEIKGAGLMARTLYDYQAREDDELTFDVDDLITNIEKVSKNWYRGTITKADNRIVGLFPANYVKLLNDSGEY